MVQQTYKSPHSIRGEEALSLYKAGEHFIPHTQTTTDDAKLKFLAPSAQSVNLINESINLTSRRELFERDLSHVVKD